MSSHINAATRRARASEALRMSRSGKSMLTVRRRPDADRDGLAVTLPTIDIDMAIRRVVDSAVDNRPWRRAASERAPGSPLHVERCLYSWKGTP